MPTQKLPLSPGHPFYERLNHVLEKTGFDAFLDEIWPLDRPKSALGVILGVDSADSLFWAPRIHH